MTHRQMANVQRRGPPGTTESGVRSELCLPWQGRSSLSRRLQLALVILVQLDQITIRIAYERNHFITNLKRLFGHLNTL